MTVLTYLGTNDRWRLSIILIVAFVLRCWGLDTQSLWLDELHTMVESDPDTSWQVMLDYLMCCDQHPPLSFALSKILFLLFGHTAVVARSLSVVVGTLSVFVLYQLGKELVNRQVGLVAALLTCFNYFNLHYSQEARPYILSFLFAAWSFVFLLRLIKGSSLKNAVLYAITALLMLYSHYFGLMVMMAQIAIGVLFFFLEKEQKKQYLIHYSISGAIIGVGFAPWLPFLLEMSAIKKFWIAPVDGDFAVSFFLEFFGNLDLLKPILALLLLHYCLMVFRSASSPDMSFKKQTLHFSFVIVLFWIGISLLVPYLRSVLVVPMLLSRYAIVVLPAFLVLIAYSIQLIPNRIVRFSVLTTIVVLALVDIFAVQDVYGKVHKTQFREMTQYITNGSEQNTTIINEVTGWQHQYYLKHFNNNAPLLRGEKVALIDSIINRTSPKYALDSFWLVGAHGDAKLAPGPLQDSLNKNYLLAKQADFYDAWAQFYVSLNSGEERAIKLDHRDFDPQWRFDYNNAAVVAIWGGAVNSFPVALAEGTYEISLLARGTKLAEEYPKLAVSVNEQEIGSYFVTGEYQLKAFTYQQQEAAEVRFKVAIQNDSANAELGEDRNAFMLNLVCKKVQ